MVLLPPTGCCIVPHELASCPSGAKRTMPLSMRLLCIAALRVGAASSDTAAADIIVRRVLDGTPTFDDERGAVVVPAGRDCASAFNEAMLAANSAGGGTVATRDGAAMTAPKRRQMHLHPITRCPRPQISFCAIWQPGLAHFDECQACRLAGVQLPVRRRPPRALMMRSCQLLTAAHAAQYRYQGTVLCYTE